MPNDALDLLLYLARQQTNMVDVRDDELIYVLNQVEEEITIQETSTLITKSTHPVHYDDANAIYDRCTYA